MAFELTEEQKTAVFAPLSENLVSAAAGSGKTKVLSERITERIKSGDTTIDRLLIVTFTRAAAAQMKERIALAIEEEYKKSKSPRLKRQLALVAGADICTIDSFCINLVKRSFFKVDVAPDFTIADNNEMRILREEVLLDVLEQMYEKGDEDFLLLAGSVGSGKNDNELKKLILKAYFFTRAFADPDGWLDGALRAHVDGSEENDRLYAFFLEEIKNKTEELGETIKKAKEEAEKHLITSYLPTLENEWALFNECFGELGEKSPEKGLKRFCFGSFSGGKRKGEEGLADEKKYVQSLHNDAKALFADILELYNVYKGEKGCSYNKIEALVKCVRLFDKIYTEEKKLKKMLEFSDCEYLAYRILNESEEICNELRDKYDEIYIDEYQDTNPLQDALFTKLSRKDRGEANLFIVGDVKQSIYRFRHSDPRVFSHKAKVFGSDDKSRKMILSKNFRSRREVIDSINCVFESVMREGTAQVEYDDEHRLKFGAEYFIEYNRNKSELYVLNDKYEAEDEEEELAKEEKETLIAARKIKELTEGGFMVFDGGRMRPVKYSDIAVLSSKINNKAEAVSKIFSLMGIPVYCEGKESFFDTVEIGVVLSLLRSVDNPLCDIPLASLMRSPVFAFTENELVEIRAHGRNVPFYENVIAEANGDSELSLKCGAFAKRLNEWREMAGVMSLERFVTSIIDESGYYAFVGALPGGGKRQANLRRLIDLAGSYENNKFKSLYNFVRYIDKTIESGGEVEGEAVIEGDCVRMMSIHKSKGLEFPVVIVIGCGSSFNDRDSYESLVMTPDAGMAIIEREKTRRVKFKTAEYRAISTMLTRENHAEQMRLLYVAMTRAKEKLIMIGTTPKAEEKVRECFEKRREISDYKIRDMKNYLEYLFAGVRPRYWDVYVVDELPQLVKAAGNDVHEADGHKIVEEVIYRLSYTYPYDGVRNVPSKMSVSEIKKLSAESEGALEMFRSVHEKRVPGFMKEKEKLTGATRGTAYHRVMELINLNETDVDGAIKGFVEKGLMTPEAAESVDTGKIEAFLKSSVAERMRKARQIMREESFTIMINAEDVYPEGENEKICVQGTIDCLFIEEDGGIVLLDYKTDFYTEEEDIIKRYKTQLNLYEVAVFNRYREKCKEKCLYMFHTNDIISL